MTVRTLGLGLHHLQQNIYIWKKKRILNWGLRLFCAHCKSAIIILL